MGPCDYLRYESKKKETVSVKELFYSKTVSYATEHLDEFYKYIN